jgi:hypothetical protein
MSYRTTTVCVCVCVCQTVAFSDLSNFHNTFLWVCQLSLLSESAKLQKTPISFVMLVCTSPHVLVRLRGATRYPLN